jgi:hypothetical protein
MEGKTYLELLAENDEEARKEFEPNAKDLLTANFVEYDDHIDGHDAHPDELEDQHEFRREQGSHQLASLMPEPPKDVHKSNTDIRYDKDTYVRVLSIDSRFRVDLLQSSSNFLFKMLSPIKNVVSIRLSSIEIPNTWFTFSETRGNTTMDLYIGNTSVITANPTRLPITIQAGNYVVNTGNDNDILVQLYNVLNAAGQTLTPKVSFSVNFDTISSKMSISCFTYTPSSVYTYDTQPSLASEIPIFFYIDFGVGPFATRNTDWGLGFNLGYAIQLTPVNTVQTATYILNVQDSTYVFISLNPDWRVVEHNQPDRSQTGAFAKVVINVPKNSLAYDDGRNTVTKTYKLRQPTNITTFNIVLLDEYEQVINLEGGDVSITLEVTEVLHSSLYEKLRQ